MGTFNIAMDHGMAPCLFLDGPWGVHGWSLVCPYGGPQKPWGYVGGPITATAAASPHLCLHIALVQGHLDCPTHGPSYGLVYGYPIIT